MTKRGVFTLGEAIFILCMGVGIGGFIGSFSAYHAGVAKKNGYYEGLLMDQRKVDAYRAKVLAEEQFTKLTSNPEQD